MIKKFYLFKIIFWPIYEINKIKPNKSKFQQKIMGGQTKFVLILNFKFFGDKSHIFDKFRFVWIAFICVLK